jgi:hypothetical protein
MNLVVAVPFMHLVNDFFVCFKQSSVEHERNRKLRGKNASSFGLRQQHLRCSASSTSKEAVPVSHFKRCRLAEAAH